MLSTLATCNASYKAGTRHVPDRHGGSAGGIGSEGITIFNTIVTPNSKTFPWSNCKWGTSAAAQQSEFTKADSYHPGGVNVLFADGSAAVAAVLRPVRAELPRPDRPEQRLGAGVDRAHVGRGRAARGATPDWLETTPIRDAGGAQPVERLARARHELDPRRVAVVRDVDDQRVVAVEEHGVGQRRRTGGRRPAEPRRARHAAQPPRARRRTAWRRSWRPSWRPRAASRGPGAMRRQASSAVPREPAGAGRRRAGAAGRPPAGRRRRRPPPAVATCAPAPAAVRAAALAPAAAVQDVHQRVVGVAGLLVQRHAPRRRADRVGDRAAAADDAPAGAR